MAAWQFTLDLIPATAARISGVEAIRLTKDQIEAAVLGLSSDEEQVLLEGLDKLMPERTGWTTKMRFWGLESGNDAHASFDAGSISGLQIRLDASNLSLALIGGVCGLTRRVGCVFAARESSAVVQPNCEAVLRAIMQSSAMRFVEDPEAFLEEASRLDRDTD